MLKMLFLALTTTALAACSSTARHASFGPADGRCDGAACCDVPCPADCDPDCDEVCTFVCSDPVCGTCLVQLRCEDGVCVLVSCEPLAPGAVVAVEERRRATVTLPPGFAALDQRAWGDTQVVLARFGRPQGVKEVQI